MSEKTIPVMRCRTCRFMLPSTKGGNIILCGQFGKEHPDDFYCTMWNEDGSDVQSLDPTDEFETGTDRMINDDSVEIFGERTDLMDDWYAKHADVAGKPGDNDERTDFIIIDTSKVDYQMPAPKTPPATDSPQWTLDI